MVILLFAASLALAATKPAAPTSAPKPPKVFVDKGACPFECCKYREWIA